MSRAAASPLQRYTCKNNIVSHVGRDINVEILCLARYDVKLYMYIQSYKSKCKFERLEAKNVTLSKLKGQMQKNKKINKISNRL